MGAQLWNSQTGFKLKKKHYNSENAEFRFQSKSLDSAISLGERVLLKPLAGFLLKLLKLASHKS